MKTTRPSGRYVEWLGITICAAENYAERVIANLAANINERTGAFRRDRDPDSVGDCIVYEDVLACTGYCKAERIYRVKLGDRWLPAQGLQHALDIVAVARSVMREAA